MLRMPALTSLNAFTPSTPWAVTTPRYSVTGRPSIPGVVVMSISVPPYLRLSLTRTEHVGSLGHASRPALVLLTRLPSFWLYRRHNGIVPIGTRSRHGDIVLC